MDSRNEEAIGHHRRRVRVGSAGGCALRITLLFGSVAVALALLLTPVLERKTRDTAVFGTDRVMTGSVERGRGAYRVRRGVLQPSPDAVCIISADGTRRGAC